MWTVDMAMKPTYISSSIRHHLGYSMEEAMCLRMETVFSPESYRLAMKVLAEELDRDEGPPDRTRTLELDLIHRDGHCVPFELCCSALRDAAGKPSEILAIVRNITDRRGIRGELRGAATAIPREQQFVQALSALIEMRDPYTAGHQRRVADLSCVMAQKMGWPAGRVESLRLAGLVHDIGKIRVPAEILSSTRRLTEAEYEIIKTHSAASHEVLSGISFPGPVAEAVYQHHERLDGSGYPRGLAGADILMEARVLAVADVVEAIASDRPYRRALGLDAALDEIAGHRGLLYDEVVVDACLEVFRKDGYALGQAELRTTAEDM